MFQWRRKAAEAAMLSNDHVYEFSYFRALTVIEVTLHKICSGLVSIAYGRVPMLNAAAEILFVTCEFR